MKKRDLALNVANASESTPAATHYELTNHLGNVMAVISDKASTTAEPTVVSLSDYYPFGMTMGGRSYSADEYRYGFQGQDKEKELWGGEASFFTYRISDNRLGRFFSVDPLSSKFPWNSSYAFSENRVIDGVEMEGLEYLDVNNPYIEEGAVENVNGQTNLTLGSKKFEGVQIENIGGVDYYNLGQHMYITDENCWSETGSRHQQQTDETKVGIQLVNNLLNLWYAGKYVDSKKELDWTTTSVATSDKVANTLVNPGGKCHVVTMSRINAAYGKNVLSTSIKDGVASKDLRISGTVPGEKTNKWYGVAGALANNGYADLVTHDEIWEGKLQIGAPVQKWWSRGKEPSGHSIIFWRYNFDEKGNVTGFDYIDSHGINGGHDRWGTVDEYSPIYIEEDKKYDREHFGGNLIDK